MKVRRSAPSVARRPVVRPDRKVLKTTSAFPLVRRRGHPRAHRGDRRGADHVQAPRARIRNHHANPAGVPRGWLSASRRGRSGGLQGVAPHRAHAGRLQDRVRTQLRRRRLRQGGQQCRGSPTRSSMLRAARRELRALDIPSLGFAQHHASGARRIDGPVPTTKQNARRRLLDIKPDRIEPRRSLPGRVWHRLSTPSARWSVLALVPGPRGSAREALSLRRSWSLRLTNEFRRRCLPLHAVGCEGIRAKRPPREPTGVIASCHDCHIPHQYPEPLVQGEGRHQGRHRRDARGYLHRGEVQEGAPAHGEAGMGGIPAQQFGELPALPRLTAEVVSKQKDFVQPMHQQFLSKAMTCIDCHKGIAHEAPAE